MSYGIVSILVISCCAAPPLIRLRRTFPHPGDRINHSMLSCRDMAPWLNTHSPTTKWWQGNWIRKEPQATENPVTRFPTGQEGGGASHQRGAGATGLERLLFPRKKSCSGKLQDLMTGRGRWSRTTDNGVKVRCLTAWRYPHIKESAGQETLIPCFQVKKNGASGGARTHA